MNPTNFLPVDQYAAHAPRLAKAFQAVLDQACEADEWRGLFGEEAEEHIRREVERKLYEPSLRNAGDPERAWIEILNAAAEDERLVVAVRASCRRYAELFQRMLPSREYVRQPSGEYMTLPGAYYTRKPVSRLANKPLFLAATALRAEAIEDRNWAHKSLADLLLAGAPEQVSNFRMDCLYLAREEDGTVTRLIKLMNVLGEQSHGPEVGGCHSLPNEQFASAEKFRGWCLSLGNFNWGVGNGAGNTELQMLHHDVSRAVAFRVVQMVQVVGWQEIASDAPAAPGSLALLDGLWFTDGCAHPGVGGPPILPDQDGIIWYQGVGYAMSRRGREQDFHLGQPKLHPEMPLEEIPVDTSSWPTQPASRGEMLGLFFREVCERFFETVGGLEGFMAVGALMAYAAAPELYRARNLFPGLWAHGQMGSGKTSLCSWLVALHGFNLQAGLSLVSRSTTTVGIMCQMENYSNVALWLDEYRMAEVGDDKLAVIRDSYNRQMASKWTPDGHQRRIRTAPIVSGESTTRDAASRSRYPHLQVAESKRMTNHFTWFTENAPHFFIFFRTLLERRPEFVEQFATHLDAWLTSPEVATVPERGRVTHGPAFAGFAAAAALFQSHTTAEVTALRRWLATHAQAAAADVASDVNVNVFVDEMVTAFLDEAIPCDCFKVELEMVEHPPGAPNQGRWVSATLYLDPTRVIAAMQVWLAKQRSTLTLRRNDLRDQLSKHAFWKQPTGGKSIVKRFSGESTAAAWGIIVDEHPAGYRPMMDAQLLEHLDPGSLGYRELAAGGVCSIKPIFIEDADPRRGPLYAVVDRLVKHHEAKARQ